MNITIFVKTLRRFLIKNIYYDELNSFFDMIEEKYSLEVIIALHPKSNRSTSLSYFKNRQVISSKTNLLVRDAEFIISHWSTAINFSVLFNKKFMLITTNQILQSKNSVFIKFLSKTFKKKITNISVKPIILDESLLFINTDCYEKYNYNYIKENKNNDLFWVIALEGMDQI